MPDYEADSASDEMRRQEIFAALVTAQDQGMPVDESRRVIGQQFGITTQEMLKIERCEVI